METVLAWALPPFALGLLFGNGGAIKKWHPIPRALAVYLCYAVVFGCIHFLWFRAAPADYALTKDLQKVARIQATQNTEEEYTSLIRDLYLIDIYTLRATSDPSYLSRTIEFSQDNTPYHVDDPIIDVHAHMHVSMVGPRRDDPVYRGILRIALKKDFRGAKEGDTQGFYIPTSGDATTTLVESEVVRFMGETRQRYVSALLDLYAKDSMSPELFSLLDFFYFSVSISGVGELIPATTVGRLLVLLQIMLFVFTIPVFLDEMKGRPPGAHTQPSPSVPVPPSGTPGGPNES
jgi:hypothetical protein